MSKNIPKTFGEKDILESGRKTILQESEALAAFAQALGDSFTQACTLLKNCSGTIVLTGMGKSGLVAKKWAATFVSTGTRAYFLNPADASHGDLGLLHSKDVLVALSSSGETDELRPVLHFAKETKVTCIVVTQNPNSTLSKMADLGLCMHLKEEACPLGLAPTTSTTLMMALGDAMAIVLMQLHSFTEKDFARLHPGGSLGKRLWLSVSQLMHTGEKIPIVSPEAPLKEVLVEMTQKCLGLAVLKDGTEVVGVITDGDLRRAFQKKGLDERLRSIDIATLNPKWVEANCLATEAAALMAEHSIQQVLVRNTLGELVGVVHLYDLLRARVV